MSRFTTVRQDLARPARSWTSSELVPLSIERHSTTEPCGSTPTMDSQSCSLTTSRDLPLTSPCVLCFSCWTDILYSCQQKEATFGGCPMRCMSQQIFFPRTGTPGRDDQNSTRPSRDASTRSISITCLCQELIVVELHKTPYGGKRTSLMKYFIE